MKKIFDNKYICWALTVLSVLTIGLIMYFCLLRYAGILAIVKKVFKIFVPFFYGIAIAYVLNQLMKFFEKTIFKKVPGFIPKKSHFKYRRIMSLLLSSLMLLAIVAFLISIIIPQLLKSFDVFVDNVPTYFKSFKIWLDDYLVNKPSLRRIVNDNYDSMYKGIIKYINHNILPEQSSVITNISSGFFSFVKTIFNIFLGFIISIYILYSKEQFIGQFKKILYSILPVEKVNTIISNLRYTDKVFNGFFVGKIIDSIIVGVICYIFMIIFKMPFPLIISLIVGITNIIPYFGPFIGAIPSAFFILIISPSKCIGFLIFIIILQQFDGNILGPKILGNKTGLKSFWVLFAILLFGGLFNFVGMIIGVPLFSIIYAFISGLCNRNLAKKNLSIKTADYVNLTAINKKKDSFVYQHDGKEKNEK